MFQIELQVRDYECDIQGIVNNAVYQHYFEHARHTFLNENCMSFFEMTKNEIFLVIYRSEIDYIIPLTYQKSFQVSVDFLRLSKLKALFDQKIFIGDEVFTRGKFYVTALNSKKKPINLDDINLNSTCVN